MTPCAIPFYFEEDVMKFKELTKGHVSDVESTFVEKWNKMNILQKSIDNRKDSKDWVFYDGPIYANAKPGIHHVFAKTIKDAFCKYKTMKGYRVLRKIGLDTHGLPIEVNVEKKLGFKSKADIEAFGVENFCKECNKATALNIDEINKVTHMMGQFIDCDNPYVTCSNEFIESEWWIINELNKKGLIYYGNKVLWYCPRCGTELSSNEVSQGYQEDPVNSIIVTFKLKDKDEYFLVWTTTPWTLIANVALCVNPDLTYVKVESMGYKFIMAESLLENVLGSDVKVLEKYKGTDLVGIKYEQLMPFVKVEGKCFEVIADSYVTDADGTGIVHIAPAYGEDDNRACRENGVGFTNPVGPDGCYTEGPWIGRLVTDKELEIDIIKYLKQEDKLFKKIQITHDYPHCWRCKSALISYPKPAWYVQNTKFRDEIIKCNNDINWYPSYVGEKRFGNWLENMIDWSISRNRYWGCPLPIWTCECGNHETIGSLDELQERVLEDVDVRKIELHRPYVDNLHIKCSKCGKTMNRVKDVMDVWFDSGSMPYAQFHYPFENKELFESQFPADFIAEGVDQTRGWFYVLLVISTLISGKSSFKNVVVNDMILDAKGKKMSKSSGNTIDPVEVMQKYGADATRWYMLYSSPVWTPLKLDEEGIKEANSKFFSTLKNTYTFFQMYANADNLDPREFEVKHKDLEDIDKWLLSKYNSLVKNVTDSMESYDLNKAVHFIQDFVCDDLSNWYIRRNRRRFWQSELDNSKKAVYKTTFDVLVGLCKLIAPISPFLSEEIYQNLTGEESVHLTDYPVYDKKLIDTKLEEKMDLVIELISYARNIREDAKIKVRQPISDVIFEGKYKEKIGEFESLFKEELNVKNVLWEKDLSKYLTISYKPNFKECGKLFGGNINAFKEYLENISDEDTIKLENGNLSVKLGDNIYDINNSYVIKSISSTPGYNAVMLNYKTVVINTDLTSDLINEGIAREIVSKVQNLRKTSGFDISDRIDMIYSGSKEIVDAVNQFKEYIMDEVLALTLEESDKAKEELKINDYDMKVSIKQIK